MSRPTVSRVAQLVSQAQLLRTSRFSSPTSPYRHAHRVIRRNLIAAPKAGGPPILERRPDRELPDVRPSRNYLIHFPLFLLSMYIATNLLFNYQRSSSSVVSSTLYALRVNPEAREVLGDEIGFKAKAIPWIRGTMDQLHGKIEITYKVKGTRGEGVVHFTSLREGGRVGKFKTQKWALELPDGSVMDLLVNEESSKP